MSSMSGAVPWTWPEEIFQKHKRGEKLSQSEIERLIWAAKRLDDAHSRGTPHRGPMVDLLNLLRCASVVLEIDLEHIAHRRRGFFARIFGPTDNERHFAEDQRRDYLERAKAVLLDLIRQIERLAEPENIQSLRGELKDWRRLIEDTSQWGQI